MTTQRFRLRQTFWLDLHKDDERQLADEIAILKNNRTFAKTIRDGIRLIADLRAGRVGVLLELFPFVREALAPSVGDRGIRDTDRWLQRIEQLLLENSMGAKYQMNSIDTASSGASGSKAMIIPQGAAPDFDDLPDVVINSASTSGDDFSKNLLKSTLSLFDDDTELIEIAQSGISSEEIAANFLGSSMMEQGSDDLWN